MWAVFSSRRASDQRRGRKLKKKTTPAATRKNPTKAPAKSGGAKPVKARRTKAQSIEAYVYILGSRQTDGDCKTYVGWTNDIDKRLAAHNAGSGAKSTRGRAWFLIYVEKCRTRNEAMSREWHIKHDRKFRKKMLEALKEVDPARREAAAP